jgi:carbonic anhydrase
MTMCRSQDHGISRRKLCSLAGAALGLSIVPRMAHAAEIEALAFSCIDYRLVGAAVKFFDANEQPKNYDILALAGASLGAVSATFPASNAAFWNHVDIAKSLHHIKKVVVLDHRDCGAYKVAFGKDYASEHAAETAQHKGVMEKLKTELAQKHPDLGSEFYLMSLDGNAERII